MNPDVSVIMGCYNSEDTLDEALGSVLSQEFRGNLELITVDDGSRDSTRAILEAAAARDPRVKVLEHSENRGGGAARNTGVRAATGGVVLVFDSDDVLGDGSLQSMFDVLSSHPDLDGALFEEQRTFRGTNKRHYEPFRYYVETCPIELRAIFEGKKALIGNFMYRKPAFEKAGGYPEHHGFDTQGFCIRFMSRGLRAQVAPTSFFWHRVSGPVASYFERVFASGRFNLNMYLIYEDMIELFSGAALNLIMDAQIFRTTGFQSSGISSRLQELERSGVSVLRKAGSEELDSRSEAFLQGVLALRELNYERALGLFGTAAKAGLASPVLNFNLIRSAIRLAGTSPSRTIEEALKAVEQLRIRKLPSTRGWTLLDRALVKAARKMIAAHGIDDPIS